MNPCKDCLDRQIGCHSSCEKYLEWNRQHKKDKEELDKKRAYDKQATTYQVESIRKAAKRRHGK